MNNILLQHIKGVSYGYGRADSKHTSVLCVSWMVKAKSKIMNRYRQNPMAFGQYSKGKSFLVPAVVFFL